jgi:aspartate 1-decarboxylase
MKKEVISMLRMMMKSKIHRATVTEANLNYVGSITIDEDIIDLVDMYVNEKVQVVNNNNGARLETYIIPGPRGSGIFCLNGAAARLVHPGDTIIVISYGLMSDNEAKSYKPKVVIMDTNNKVIQTVHEEPHSTIF